MTNISADELRKAALKKLAECRKSFEAGAPDFAGLEQEVFNYCSAVARLPLEQGREHVPHLEALMKEVDSLGQELVHARDAVGKELASLGRLRQANVAYHRTDFIAPERKKRKAEEN